MEVETEVGNDFARTACGLLREYTQQLKERKQQADAILDRFNDLKRRQLADKHAISELGQLQQRYHFEMDELERSTIIYQKLARQVSQWIQHGKTAAPGLQLEMEVRLAELEQAMESTQDYLSMNSPHL